MTPTHTNGWLKRPTEFWRDLIEPRTYLNIAYLLLSFPLGIAYFVVLVTLLAVGLGLSITVIGIPVLLMAVGFVWVAARLEREMALFVLGQPSNTNKPASQSSSPSSSSLSDAVLIAQDQPASSSKTNQSTPSGTHASSNSSWWRVLRTYLSSPRFWKAFTYQVLKFPLGIASFVAVVVMTSVSLALAGLPFYAPFSDIPPVLWKVDVVNFWQIAALCLVGIGLLMISARALNLMAEAQARWALTMLDPDEAASNLKP